MRIRQFFLTFALCVICAFGASASSDTSTTRSFQTSVKNFLQSEGYAASIDEDGDIKFKYQGKTYFIITKDHSGNLFNVSCILGLSVDAPENNNQALKLYRIANKVNNDQYWTKAYVIPRDGDYSFRFVVETLEASAADYKTVVLKYLESIANSYGIFKQEY